MKWIYPVYPGKMSLTKACFYIAMKSIRPTSRTRQHNDVSLCNAAHQRREMNVGRFCSSQNLTRLSQLTFNIKDADQEV